jgi:hypothetical protein
MDILNMMGSQAVQLWLAQSTVVFFIIAGITLLAIGISLLANSAATLQFFGRMNRWVSMRSTTKPLEIPHDTRQAVQKYRYWLAAVFVIGGIFAVSGLLTGIDTRGVIRVFGLEFMRPAYAEWVVDSARWVLVVGNLVGIVVGILLAFFPATVVKIEARGSQWYSERKATKGADNLNLKLDAWVVAHPRPAGWGIVVFALALIGAFALMLPKVW